MYKLIGRAVLPLLGLSLLAGCASSGGTAAIVNGVVVPDSKVTSFSNGCSQIMMEKGEANATPQALRQQMVAIAVIEEMGKQQIASSGQAPSEDEIMDELEERGLDVLLENADCAEAVTALARHNVLALSHDDYFGSYEVELNPRYGVWNPEMLTAGGSSSLSDAAAV